MLTPALARRLRDELVAAGAGLEAAAAERGYGGFVEAVAETFDDLDGARATVGADDQIEHDRAFDAGSACGVGVGADRLASVHRTDSGWEVRYAAGDGTRHTVTEADLECAYALALLTL